IAGMKHPPGKPNKAHRDQQRGVGRRQAQGDKGGSAERESKHQHQPRADLVDEKPDRQLSRDRGDARDGQRKAQFDKADAERRLQEREQWRQNQTLEMLDEVRGRNDRDRAGFAPRPPPLASRESLPAPGMAAASVVISVLPPGTAPLKISALVPPRQSQL